MMKNIKIQIIVIYFIIFFSIDLFSVKLNYFFNPDIFTIINTEINSNNYLNGKSIGKSRYYEISTLNPVSFDGKNADILKSDYFIEEKKFLNKINRKILSKETFIYNIDIFGKTEEQDITLGFHDFPKFPDKELEIGDTWELPAQYIIKLYNTTYPVKLDISIQYKLVSIEVVNGDEYAEIAANAVFLKDRKQLKFLDENIIKLGGFSNFYIYFNVTKSRLESIEEIYDFYYLFTDFSVIETAGRSNTNYTASDVFSEEDINDSFMILKDENDIRVELEKNKAISVTLSNIQYKPDSDKLPADELNRFDKVINVLGKYRSHQIIIIGHTADIGEKKGQKLLSERRAKYIMDLLIEKYNFDKKNINYIGMGGEEPISDNETSEGRANNRRIEFLILP